MTSEEEAARLQLRMQRIRRRLDTDVDEIIEEAQQLLDWKYYLQRQPLPSVVAAAVLGYLLVPPRQPRSPQSVYLDPEATREFLSRNGAIPVPQEPKKSAIAGILMSLGTLALNSAIRSGMNYATSFAQQAVRREFQPENVRQERPDDSHQKWTSRHPGRRN